MDVFVVIQKGKLSMFTFGDYTAGSSGAVGGGNWLVSVHFKAVHVDEFGSETLLRQTPTRLELLPSLTPWLMHCPHPGTIDIGLTAWF